MSLISFVAGWALTMGSSTEKASQTTVTQLLAEVDLIKRVLIENGIGVAQVPTKPSAEPPAPKATATPKETAAPKATATPKATAAPKASTTAKPVAVKAVKGKPCTADQKDPTNKLTCAKNPAGKFIWGESLATAPKKPPTGETATSGGN
jgi:hypothetical protein